MPRHRVRPARTTKVGGMKDEGSRKNLSCSEAALILAGDWSGSTSGSDGRSAKNVRFSLGRTTKDHISAPVPISAKGPGAENLVGGYENTNVPDVTKEALLREGGQAR